MFQEISKSKLFQDMTGTRFNTVDMNQQAKKNCEH